MAEKTEYSDKTKFERTETKVEFVKNFPRDKLKIPKDYNNNTKFLVLICCGSFSPVTLAHLRLFETSKNAAEELGWTVIGGYFSAVGDSYKKEGLEATHHRNEMLKAGTKSSDWIMVDEWESQQKSYIRTAIVLEHFEKQLNPPNQPFKVQVSLACGADLLESFKKPGVWDPQDLKEILQRNIFCLTREDINIHNIIWDSNILYSYRKFIHPIQNHIPNGISSTKIRQALSRNLSIKYLVPDEVVDYIKKNSLYDSKV